MRILCLTDNRDGHRNKAFGLINAMSRLRKLEQEEFPVKWRWSGVRQILSRTWGGAKHFPLSWFLKETPEMKPYDLIVSAGGSTQWPNAVMAYKLGVPNLFLGSPRAMSPRLFTAIMMHDSPLDTPHYLRYELIPSIVSPQAAKEATEKECPDVSGQAWGLILGGDGEGCHWSENDFRQMLETFFSNSRRLNREVWIATSRRTPEVVEDYARELVFGYDKVEGVCWYHKREQPSVSLLAMMGACECLLVTADSMSMTHEAIASGRPVISILPENGEPNQRLAANLGDLGRLGRISCRKHNHIVDTLNHNSPDEGWNTIQFDPNTGFAEEVLKLIDSISIS